MNRKTMLALACLVLTAGGASAQDEKQPATDVSAQGSAQGQASASAEAGQASASLAQGTEVSATLTKPVDSGKAKPGDEVHARAEKDIRSDGEVVVPRGSALIGRVTRAEPRRSAGDAGGKSPSTLGIVFDRAVLEDGREVALNGTVAAVGAARAAGSANGVGRATAGGSSGGGLAGTAGGAVGGIAGATAGATGRVGAAVGATADIASRSAGAVGGFDAASGLKSGSRGVFGFRDLDLAADAGGTAGGAVITSTGRSVRLESGTQLLLVAGKGAGESAQSTGQPPPREASDNR